MDKNDSRPVVVLRIEGGLLSTKRCTLDYSAGWIAPLLARGVPDRDLLIEARYLVCLDPITPVEFRLVRDHFR